MAVLKTTGSTIDKSVHIWNSSLDVYVTVKVETPGVYKLSDIVLVSLETHGYLFLVSSETHRDDHR